jgi:hypothetical protein
MDKKTWKRIKALAPGPGHYVCRYGTYDIGRNKAKRAARAAGHKHIGKARRR